MCVYNYTDRSVVPPAHNTSTGSRSPPLSLPHPHCHYCTQGLISATLPSLPLSSSPPSSPPSSSSSSSSPLTFDSICIRRTWLDPANIASANSGPPADASCVLRSTNVRRSRYPAVHATFSSRSVGNVEEVEEVEEVEDAVLRRGGRGGRDGRGGGWDVEKRWKRPEEVKEVTEVGGRGWRVGGRRNGNREDQCGIRVTWCPSPHSVSFSHFYVWYARVRGDVFNPPNKTLPLDNAYYYVRQSLALECRRPSGPTLPR